VAFHGRESCRRLLRAGPASKATTARAFDTGEYALIAARQILDLQTRQQLALEALEVDSDWPAGRLIQAIGEAISMLRPDPAAPDQIRADTEGADA
jgi:hypothetical protein